MAAANGKPKLSRWLPLPLEDRRKDRSEEYVSLAKTSRVSRVNHTFVRVKYGDIVQRAPLFLSLALSSLPPSCNLINRGRFFISDHNLLNFPAARADPGLRTNEEGGVHALSVLTPPKHFPLSLSLSFSIHELSLIPLTHRPRCRLPGAGACRTLSGSCCCSRTRRRRCHSRRRRHRERERGQQRWPRRWRNPRKRRRGDGSS